MGQSPSSTSRHDNASTRTLHSTSIHSSRPPTFFQRLSHKLHKPRRFNKRRRARRQQQQQQQQQQPATTSSVTQNTAITAPSTTSSVRYETQEAARAAVAVTGPNLLYHLQSQSAPSDNASGGTVSFQDNSNTIEPTVNPQDAITHTEEEAQGQQQEIAQPQYQNHQDESQEQQQQQQQQQPQPQPRRRSSSSNSNNISIISLFQLPSFLNSQENGDDNESLEGGSGSGSGSSNTSLPGLLSLILLSYFGQLTNDMPGTSFITIQRPQSEHSSSSIETMRSVPFSLTTTSSISHQPNNTTTGTNDNNENSGSDSSTNSSNENNSNDNNAGSSSSMNNNDTTTNHRRRTERSVILILHGPGSSSLSDNPTYEELLMLGTMLGQVRPDTTTQAAVDEAIPVTFWSEATKKELIGTDQCLVCLDEFVIEQPVRILKCRHVFHRECVDRWLCESHNSCPVCRRVPVETNDS